MSFLEEMGATYRIRQDRCILGGFSQGGMMAYQMGLPRPDRFAGVFALSSTVKSPNLIQPRLPEQRNQPIFVAHGTADMIAPIQAGRESRDLLRKWGFSPEYHEYEGMAHEIRQEVIDDFVGWLNRLMRSEPQKG